jgi:hypothetical protein
MGMSVVRQKGLFAVKHPTGEIYQRGSRAWCSCSTLTFQVGGIGSNPLARFLIRFQGSIPAGGDFTPSRRRVPKVQVDVVPPSSVASSLPPPRAAPAPPPLPPAAAHRRRFRPARRRPPPFPPQDRRRRRNRRADADTAQCRHRARRRFRPSTGAGSGRAPPGTAPVHLFAAGHFPSPITLTSLSRMFPFTGFICVRSSDWRCVCT